MTKTRDKNSIDKTHNLLSDLTDDQETIIALCTPRGSGAIALLRLSGDNAIEIADCIAKLSSGYTLSSQVSHTIHHGFIIDSKNIIDEVMFFLMRAPKTFTGQNTVEITSHNNQFIIEKIINLAVCAGARSAKPGEFTKRAFLNKKIDLVQAEAILDVIHAQTELALHKSMAQLHGTLSSVVNQVETELVYLLSFIEASFEFLDEEQRDLDFNKIILDRSHALQKLVGDIKSQFNVQQQIKEGVRIAIIGIVNAGKSTLFNALIKQDRAIVTNIEGTTRDSIESGMYKKGNFLLFVDTAGLRSTSDIIEQQGIERSFIQAAKADIVLLVVDPTRTVTDIQRHEYEKLVEQYREKIIVVINKIDEATIIPAYEFLAGMPMLKVSAHQGSGIEDLERVVEEKIQELFKQLQSPFLLNQRQYQLLTEIDRRLDFIVNGYQGGIHYELVAYQVKELLEKVSELTGKNVTEQMLDTVFGTFCVGK